MPFVSGPVDVLLLACAVAATFVVWLLRRRRYPGPRLHGSATEIDREELEEAEREVKELDITQRPEDDVLGDDWGPGAARPRPPVRL